MRILDSTGDTTMEWTDELSAAEVEERFNELVNTYRTHMGYVMPSDGGNPTMVRTFDRTAEEIILSPRLAGG